MVELPVLPRSDRLQTRSRNGWRDRVLFGVRVIALVAMLAGIHRLTVERVEHAQSETALPIPLAIANRHFPTATELSILPDSDLWEARDVQFEVLGYFANTSPMSDGIVGYSGANQLLLVLDPKLVLRSVDLLRSGDTREHADLVREDGAFWQQFSGLAWQDPTVANLDGVAGATLTSLAIVESVAFRMSGERLSLRFPDPLTLEEVQPLADGSAQLEAADFHGIPAWEVVDSGGQRIGTAVRTGNLLDSVEGYQGPSELICFFDVEDVLRGIRLRESYDNEPYVGYVRQEYSFWPLFKGRGLTALAELDLEAEGIEGVSGATMTSMAVAETVQQSAAIMMAPKQENAVASKPWNWSWPEITTAGIALVSVVWSRSRFRRSRKLRFAWQLICVVGIGLYAGNLLSIGLFTGWAQAGVPYLIAPGLAILLLVALIVPVVTGSNVYCDHVCPHGAIQQWMVPWARRWGRRNGSSPVRKRMASALRISASLVILLAVGSVLFDVSVPLARLEPFDAYAWRIGISISLIVWCASIAMSFWRPMSYCQLACPTGMALDVLRRSRRGRGSLFVDSCVVILTAVIWLQVLLS